MTTYFQNLEIKNSFLRNRCISRWITFMWRNFFGSKARIIGIDMNPNAKKWEKHGFEIFIGSQSDKNFWRNLCKKLVR